MNAFGCWTFAISAALASATAAASRALEASARGESGIGLLNPSKLNAFDPKQTGLLANQL